MPWRRRISSCFATVAAAVAFPVAGAAAAAPAFGDAAGLHVVSVKQLSPRLHKLRVTTADLPRPVDLRVLLPTGYDDPAAAARRFPVLYLFHGTSGRAADWTTMGDAEAITAGLPLIVVMPDAGFDGDGGGYFADAFNGGAGGPPRWESFHIDGVLPWADATLRTIAERRGRAVYGLSQGGFGAMLHAARHPDLFAAAGSFSGPLDIAADPDAATLMTAIVTGTEVGLNGDAPGSIFGPRLTQEVNWRGHDPATLAANLRGMDLRLYTGNGRPGPLDPPGTAVNPIEAGAHRLTNLFHDRLQALRIPSTFRDFGPGTHSWPYWAAALRDSIKPLMDVLLHPRPAPARVDYTTIESPFRVFGWRVTVDRPAREFATLSDAAADGFTLAGSGTARVLTPPAYAPRTSAAVRVTGLHADMDRTLRADGAGRLAIDVPLGPGNAQQAFTPAALLAGGTPVHTTRVRITGATAAAAECAGRALRITLPLPRGTRPVGPLRVAVGSRRAGRVVRQGRTVRFTLPALPTGVYRVRVSGRRTRAAAGGTVALRATRTVACGPHRAG
ncbi:hypothetical protein DSM112329_05060 [Paraconexibacter sp. AEG42_29]|uniref:Esterase family protein n=1 Tax=Paraconexibacter sp. AEG42_29 TaxID=2997339 RepID=A0AAU7B2P1_9ACTN